MRRQPVEATRVLERLTREAKEQMERKEVPTSRDSRREEISNLDLEHFSQDYTTADEQGLT